MNTHLVGVARRLLIGRNIVDVGEEIFLKAIAQPPIDEFDDRSGLETPTTPAHQLVWAEYW